MKRSENAVLKMAIQIGGGCGKATPEAIVMGYAKMLLMDENALRALFTDKEREELDKVRTIFEKNKLDLNLIRSGLSSLYPWLRPNSEQQKELKKFTEYVIDGECDESEVSGDVVSKAIESTMVPMSEIFAEGNSINDVFSYINKLKGKPEQKPIETVKETPAKKSEPSKTSYAEMSRNMSKALLDVVKGQDAAVMRFVEGYIQGEMTATSLEHDGPRSHFFFFGPPGVGKTLLANKAARYLGLAYHIFDATDYLNPTDVLNNILAFASENPKGLIVFDEIEKAHPVTIRTFLQILGTGTANSPSGKGVISFKKNIIIFTSNLGKELYDDRTVNLSMMPDKVLLDAIASSVDPNRHEPVFPPEIISRLATGHVIPFGHLSVRELADMVQDTFEKVADAVKTDVGYTITYPPLLPQFFLFHKGTEIDARVAAGMSRKFLLSEIGELTRLLQNDGDVASRIEAINFDIDWDNLNPELKHLFENNKKTQILVVGDKETLALFDFEKDNVEVLCAVDEVDAKDIFAQNDIVAIFVDPMYEATKRDLELMSVADFDTAGVRFFHEMAEKEYGIPMYILDVNNKISAVDSGIFVQEGAADVLKVEKTTAKFSTRILSLLNLLYMEKMSSQFTGQGWVLQYNTKQSISSEGQVDILFYDIKKKMAVGTEGRKTLVGEADRPKLKFADVFGADNAKEELMEFVEYLKDPKTHVLQGEDIPKGVLLYGPPGTGKTTLAKAMAGECDVAFIACAASDFPSRYYGEAEENVRKVFATARKYAPSILFIDEIDAIGRQRTGTNNTANEDTLTALLDQMQGFDSKDPLKPVFVLAATNYAVNDETPGTGKLDDALVRRFDNRILVDLPKEKDRKAYLEYINTKKKLGIDATSIDNVAERAHGMSLAVLENIVNLARRDFKKGKYNTPGEALLEAYEDYKYGEKRESDVDYLRSVAIHETGHAFVGYFNDECPSFITVESRGNFGGYMQPKAEEKAHDRSREQMLGDIRTSLAGRAAEMVFFPERALTSGAGSDLSRATNVAFNMLIKYGMEENQMIVLSREEVMGSPLAGEYISKVNAILAKQMEITVDMIKEGRSVIEKIADKLIKDNNMTGTTFEEIMKTYVSEKQ